MWTTKVIRKGDIDWLYRSVDNGPWEFLGGVRREGEYWIYVPKEEK